jgi:hypothetical protein
LRGGLRGLTRQSGLIDGKRFLNRNDRNERNVILLIFAPVASVAVVFFVVLLWIPAAYARNDGEGRLNRRGAENARGYIGNIHAIVMPANPHCFLLEPEN